MGSGARVRLLAREAADGTLLAPYTELGAINGPERGGTLPHVNGAVGQRAGALDQARIVAAPVQHGIVVVKPVPSEIPCICDKWPNLPGGETNFAVWNKNDSRLPRYWRSVHHLTRIDIMPQDCREDDREAQVTNQLRRSKCG